MESYIDKLKEQEAELKKEYRAIEEKLWEMSDQTTREAKKLLRKLDKLQSKLFYLDQNITSEERKLILKPEKSSKKDFVEKVDVDYEKIRNDMRSRAESRGREIIIDGVAGSDIEEDHIIQI